MCYPPERALFSEIQVENRPLACLDDNGEAEISVLLRSSNDHVRSNRQRHDIGNFIVRGMLAVDVFKELSTDRVDGVKAARKVPRAAIVEFIGRDIDGQVPLGRLGGIIQVPWPYRPRR